ncbi:urocanate reductase precursor [Clostridium homopropionicum DSM 5847]|uniref:Urocanate reductase n=1 Tax=Clostridium homopropionicum DSM 5847 TaxID=1121318 RepID=A0A0L6ZAL7_9CLOT|nr:FMN-binding protein [Clostridium homopropionicum]KOA20015.1 urocanate reductase precursor [Clostridium homopropionicum DSM 5847]SFG64779.1 FMN-binding domain-containing protein [Clostridium homopropionicum]
MDLLLNFGFAWISVILTIILSIIYILRKMLIKSKYENKVLASINKSLRKYHKEFGIALVITGFIHGYFSSDEILSFNLGTVAWVVSILLGLNWMARKVLSKYRGWIYYHRGLTVIFILTILLHVVQVGGIQVHKILLESGVASNQKVTANNINKTLSGATFKDGIYTGEADGFRPGLKVSVEIKDNKITSIEILEHNEVNSRYYQKAFDNIPQAILNSQSIEVDATSGATFTSIGIMNAVNNALSQALVSGTLPDTKALPQNRGHGKGDRERKFDFESRQ